MNKSLKAVLFLVLGLALTGCVTQIPIAVTKPAEVNLANIRTLSVLEFDYDRDVQGIPTVTFDTLFETILRQILTGPSPNTPSVQERAATYARSKVIRTLLDTRYFSIVDLGDSSRTLQRYQDQAQFFDVLRTQYQVDGVLLGSLPLLQTTETKELRIRTIVDPQTNQETEVEEEWITRQVTVEFEYRVVSTTTRELLVQRSFGSSISSSALLAEYDRLDSEEAMYRALLDEIIATMGRQLVPYQVTESRSLMRDKTKDPNLDLAGEFVEVRNYSNALNIFLTRWDETRNIAAGYNAAIMYEALGDIASAVSQMSVVLDLYPDRTVSRALDRLRIAQAEQQAVDAQLRGR